MKQLTVTIIILGLIIGLGLWTNSLLHQSAEELVNSIDKITAEIKDDRWAEAVNHTGELGKAWKDQAGWWPIILHHEEIDNIEFSLAKTKEYISNRDKTLSLGQLSELRIMIKHIPAKEAVTLRNIL